MKIVSKSTRSSVVIFPVPLYKYIPKPQYKPIFVEINDDFFLVTSSCLKNVRLL